MRRRKPFILALALVVLLLMPTGSVALVKTGDGKWYWQNPIPQGNYLMAVDFVDQSVGWAVGYRGTILKSTNGGASWTAQKAGTGENANTDWSAVTAVNEDTAYVVGERLIMKTIDGGGTWVAPSVLPEMSTHNYADVVFVDERRGWVFGQDGPTAQPVINRTNDGGSTWTLQQQLPSYTDLGIPAPYGLVAACFATRDVGWAIGRYSKPGTLEQGSVLLYTTDGGANWSGYDLEVQGDTDVRANAITCLPNDVGHVWIAGDKGLFLLSETGAKSSSAWDPRPIRDAGSFTGIYFADESNGWAVGAQGDQATIMRTTSGGNLWTPQRSGTSQVLNAVCGFADDRIWAVGRGGAITYTLDGGATDWNKLTDDAKRQHLWGIQYLDSDPSKGWSVGENGTIMHTSTSGLKWELQDSGLDPIESETGSEKVTLHGVCFVDDQLGYVVGAAGKYFGAAEKRWTILRTTDGGSNWMQLSGPDTAIPAHDLHDVAFVNAQEGWAVGENGIILRTVNGGTTWSSQKVAAGVGLYSIEMKSAVNGWAVGDAGTVVRTTNGASWWRTELPEGIPRLPITSFFRDVEFLDNQNGWAVGSWYDFDRSEWVGQVIRTSNGGSSWSLNNPPGLDIAYLTSVSFANAATGWIAGYIAAGTSDDIKPLGWTVLKSEDGGSGWQADDPGAGFGLSLWAVDAFMSGSEPSVVGVGDLGAVMGNYFITVAAPEPPVWRSATAGHTSGQHYVDLEWQNPTAADFAGVRILRSTAATEPAQTPDADGHELVYEGMGTSYRDQSGLVGDTTYHYTAFAKDSSGNWSVGARREARTLDGESPGDDPPGDDPPVDDGWPELIPGASRVSGDDRYLTSVEASKRGFDSADTVVVATGERWPDALGGSALAGAVRGPLLLTRPRTLPQAVFSEIERLTATKAYVLGGTSAVSADVEGMLVEKLGRANVIRLAGSDRYGTASRIADEVIRIAGDDFSRDAMVATGANFPDATAASPIAAALVRPILLANPRSGALYVPTGIERVMILGSTGAVPSAVENSLIGRLGAANVERKGGGSRYATAALVAQAGVDAGMRWNGVGIATGTSFPDALAGGAMLGAKGSVLLLTPTNSLDSAARNALAAQAESISTLHVIGGPSAISSGVYSEAKDAATVN